MICPDKCTMVLIGSYRGTRIHEVYQCRFCTVTSYRSVGMSDYKIIEGLEKDLEKQEKLVAEVAAENAELRESLRSLIDHYDSVTCHHDHTHRGGVIWTICDDCGMKWSDDRSPFTPYVEPEWVTRARDLLSGKLAHKADTTEELREQLAAKDAELERVRSDRGKLASAATLVVSNWDIFEMQDTTARQVFGSSIGWLRDALASPAGDVESKDANRHGLDARYFREKLGQLVRDADNYTPEEMHLALVRLAETARPAPATECAVSAADIAAIELNGVRKFHAYLSKQSERHGKDIATAMLDSVISNYIMLEEAMMPYTEQPAPVAQSQEGE